MGARTTDFVPVVAGEKLSGEVDFAGNIDSGDVITGAQVTAIWADDRSDATAVLFGSPTVTGKKVEYGVQHAGTPNRTAIVIVLAEMQSGQVFGHRIEVENL